MSKPENPPLFYDDFAHMDDGTTRSFASTDITLRDLFAGIFNAAMIGSPEFAHASDTDTAELAYKHADAMLAERAKERA